MAVKSSTKKRLIELGVSEEHAHKLADDANLDAIKVSATEAKSSFMMAQDRLDNYLNGL